MPEDIPHDQIVETNVDFDETLVKGLVWKKSMKVIVRSYPLPSPSHLWKHQSA
jgi:hypothetical protein